MTSALLHGSYAAIFLGLAVTGLGVPISEDLVMLGAGMLAQRQGARLWGPLAVCYAGILTADLTLFLIARRLGAAVYRHRLLRRLVPERRRLRLAHLIERRGPGIVLLGRLLPGLRSPAIVLLGVHGMRLRSFLAWDALALAVAVPVVVGLGYLFSGHVPAIAAVLSDVGTWLMAAAVAAGAGFALHRAASWAGERFGRFRARPPARRGPVLRPRRPGRWRRCRAR